VFDLRYYAYKFGLDKALDNKMLFLARNPFKIDFIIELANRYSQFIKSILGKKKKCLVLDLDNTLWGGIVGEDGINGIAIGHDYPGNVYREIQSIIKQYSNQGVILAVNSRNNLNDVKEVFDKHPDMILRWNDFAAERVNWKNKAENMKDIAEELNIGIDSFVFVDDSSFEIEMVKQTYPEVETVQFTNSILHNLELIKNIDSFHNLCFLESDLGKSRQYKDQAKRNHLKASAANIEDFYRSLEMQAEIRLCDGYALKRVAQLTQKTNQFNLTTKRYTEGDIERFMNSEDYRVYYLRLSDRFGDNGITGVIIIQEKGNDWCIDTFLLSCRIIGRTAETAFLSFIQEEAINNNKKHLIGEYVSTPKNRLVRDFYEQHGFSHSEGLWMLDVSKRIEVPEWIELFSPQEET
jgi:FkbH-like protein